MFKIRPFLRCKSAESSVKSKLKEAFQEEGKKERKNLPNKCNNNIKGRKT